MHIKRLIHTIAFLVFCHSIHGQAVIKGFEYGEIKNITEAYRQAPNLGFDVQYSFADSARQDSITDVLYARYKMKDGKYWAMIDSTEIIQGHHYLVAIYHYDSVIAVSNAQKYADIMQLPVMDSLFRVQNIDSMQVTGLNDSLRMLQMYFNPLSQYTGFQITYDKNSYRVHSIRYFIRQPVDDDNPQSTVSMVRLDFSNYSAGVIDDDYFREDKFIYKELDTFYTKSPYDHYQLMINVH